MRSSWPWMNGIDDAMTTEVTPPVNDLDKRADVLALIRDHRAAIDAVCVGLQESELYDPTKHDDLWILRFVLSHKGKIPKAIAAAKTTLEFRATHALDATDIRYAPIGSSACKCEAMHRYLQYAEPDFGQGCLPDRRLGPIVFLRMAALDQHGLVENVAAEDWLPTFCYVNEWSFQWCDFLTRTTGRLTKFVRIVDVSGGSLSDFNRECGKRDGAAMGIMEDCYPQAMQAVFVCNPPAFVDVIWNILRPIIPSRVVDKFDFICPAPNPKDRKRLYPYVSQEHLPARFGGDYEVWPVQHDLPVFRQEEEAF